MKGEERAERSDQHRAEAALELLKSLASAGDDPEQFAKACTDWTRLSGDATSVPEFQSVMSLLSRGQSTDSSNLVNQTDEAIRNQYLFELDANGAVVNVSRELSEFMALKTGDILDVSQVQVDPARFDRGGTIVEAEDRFGIIRKLKIQPIFEGEVCLRMSARAGLFKFSEEVTTRMQEEYGLTGSEIEILQLTLRRLNLEQIAAWRRIRLSTVRTHVSRAINKLNCHSLVEAITTVLELSNIVEAESAPFKLRSDELELPPRRIMIGTDEMVEYRRYGAAQGRSLVILHSLEYGYLPSEEMILAAREQNINLVFPLRPGFGATSTEDSDGASHRVVARFIEAMGLSEVTLIGLSTSAPLALQVGRKCERINNLILVNYGLNVSDKLKDIQPAWIRGMLRMALNSPSSFKIGLGAIRSIVRSYGGLRFYKRLYRNQSADEQFLSQHHREFEQFSDYLLSADAQSVRHDIVSAFLPNRDIENAHNIDCTVRVINSSNQHGVTAIETRKDAARLGIAFNEVACEGRNWLFQHPREFFRNALN